MVSPLPDTISPPPLQWGGGRSVPFLAVEAEHLVDAVAKSQAGMSARSRLVERTGGRLLRGACTVADVKGVQTLPTRAG